MKLFNSNYFKTCVHLSSQRFIARFVVLVNEMVVNTVKKGESLMTHKFSVTSTEVTVPQTASLQEVITCVAEKVNSFLSSVPVNTKPKVSVHWRNIDKFISGKTVSVTAATVEYVVGSTPLHFIGKQLVVRKEKDDDTEPADVSADAGDEAL